MSCANVHEGTNNVTIIRLLLVTVSAPKARLCARFISCSGLQVSSGLIRKLGRVGREMMVDEACMKWSSPLGGVGEPSLGEALLPSVQLLRLDFQLV